MKLYQHFQEDHGFAGSLSTGLVLIYLQAYAHCHYGTRKNLVCLSKDQK